MALVTTDNRYYSEIASAIREKIGGSALYTPAQMAAAIKSIQGGEAMSIATIREICGYTSDGYKLLEYIQSSGTQYIDTGYTVKTNTRIVCDFQLTSTPSATNVLFRNASYGFGWQSSGVFRSWGGSVVDFSVSATERYTVDKRATSCTLGSTSQTTTAHAAQSLSLPLFAYKNSSGTISQYVSAKMYSCQIYEDDTLVRDFVPCINPDGAYGLYDKVNEQFYASAGSGSFTGA